MANGITQTPPLLSPANVQALSTQLANLNQAIADANRIEQCGFDCGDIRATLHALSQTIQTMLVQLGNVPIGAVNAIGGPMPQIGGPPPGGVPQPIYYRCPDGTFQPLPPGGGNPCPVTGPIRE